MNAGKRGETLPKKKKKKKKKRNEDTYIRLTIKQREKKSKMLFPEARQRSFALPFVPTGERIHHAVRKHKTRKSKSWVFAHHGTAVGLVWWNKTPLTKLDTGFWIVRFAFSDPWVEGRNRRGFFFFSYDRREIG